MENISLSNKLQQLTSSWSSSSELAWVGQVLFELKRHKIKLHKHSQISHLLGLLESDVGNGGNGQQVLETVGNGVRNGSLGSIADSQRGGGDVADSGLDTSTQVVGGDVQNLR